MTTDPIPTAIPNLSGVPLGQEPPGIVDRVLPVVVTTAGPTFSSTI